QMLCLGRKTAKERVASFLISQLRHGAGYGDGGAEFDLPMSRSDIADYLGLTIETVSRTFTALREEGLIGLPATHHISIPDIATLEASTEA
ncbi:MAG: helix-turn-helix domain-containing protein, partial [Alphaproteobacteria bacterium]